MTADAWEPVDFLAEFRERQTCLREVTELLKEKAQAETGKLWAHHLPRVVDALGFFQGLLQDEIDHFGEWRYHEFQHDEVLDFIDKDLDKLAIWLCRMTIHRRRNHKYFQAVIAQFAAVTRVKERPGFPIANDLKGEVEVSSRPRGRIRQHARRVPSPDKSRKLR